MSGEQECRKCDGERTHPMTDAMPCDWCGGSGVEPMNAPQSDTDPKEFVPSGCDCGNCDKPSGTDPTSELVERLRALVGRLLARAESDAAPDGSIHADDAFLVLAAADALAAAGTAPTPPTVSADLLERIRERTVSSALEGADPLMVDLYAALTAAPTAPAVDVTDYAVVADDGWRDGGYQTETEAIEAAIAYNAPPATEQHHVVEVGTVERQVWPVRAQGVPSTDPSGGA